LVSYTPLLKFSSGPCENSLGFDSSIDLKGHNEIEAFNGMLEGAENTLAAFEKRRNKTEELFDEWNCIFIMYAPVYENIATRRKPTTVSSFTMF